MALLCAILSAFFLIISSTLSWYEWKQAMSRHRYTDMLGFYFHVGATILPVATWGFLRLGPRREKLLIGIDCVGTLLVSVLLTLMGVTMDVAEGMIQALLALVLIAMVRAIVVPSTGKRTLFISGTASVLATHALLRRETAIKMLLPGRMAPTAVARFEREVHQLARLNHPNTIAIYDYGRTPDGVFYYAMEYVDGLDLEDLVQAIGPLPPGRVVHLLTQICESLAEAHELGLVHRDIKPANVLVGQRGGIPDSVNVLDFGLVKDIGNTDGVSLTAAERFVGTPLYASPEAIRSVEGVTFASDLYSLGAIGYCVLTGTHLVQRETFIDVCAQHLYEIPEPPSQRLGKPLPPMLEMLILQALAKTPEQRPASAKEFARSLRACTDVSPWSEDAARQWWADVGCALVRRKHPHSSLGLDPRGTAAE